MIYARLSEKKLHLSGELEDQKAVCAPDDPQAIARALLKVGYSEGSIMCSSSMDFPEDAGLPEDFDARDYLGKGVALLYPDPVTLPNGEVFSGLDVMALARMVCIRFGRDMTQAAAGWSRMFQTPTTVEDFEALLRPKKSLPVRTRKKK